ncbi:RING-CH-type domain-containing protein [Mycena kentingensis (nom. inval.)]|nr:RING-CH-type domain-containing protein [Mycena kentingensis (nom. inval.)]
MQEADEQDTCRICSAPAEPEQPLFYPCKCSGTIRYIHQDCLTTWLAHSKKKHCDVCKHPYAFTKVYATDMPSSLPPVLLLRRVAQQTFFATLFAIRGVIVGGIWLAVLPWATVMTWRMYFAMGDSTAWWISDRERPANSPEYRSPIYLLFYAESTVDPPPETFIARVAAHPLWQSLHADIFTGQIIASLVVLTFVAVFLLREWISQNARPGVFEDEEHDAAAAPPPQLLEPPQQAAPHPNPNVNDRVEVRAERRMEAIRALERQAAFRAMDPRVRMAAHMRRTNLRERPSRKRRISHDDDNEDDEVEVEPAAESSTSAVNRERAGRLRSLRRRRPSASAPDGDEQPDADKFEFTFRAQTRLPRPHPPRRSSSVPPSINFSPAPPRESTPSPTEGSSSDGFLKVNIVKPENVELPESDDEHLPADLLDLEQPIPTRDLLPHLESALERSDESPDLLAGTARIAPRRPELPLGSGSPTLATYRAPEDLVAGPSGQHWADAAARPSSTEFDTDWSDIQRTVRDSKGKGKAKASDSDLGELFGLDTDEEDEMERVREQSREQADFDQYFAVPGEDEGMPPLQAVSDSEEEEEDEEDVEDGASSPRTGLNEDEEDGDDEDEEEEEPDYEEEEGVAPHRVQFDNAAAPVWQAIQIEDDEVAEVGDGEMDVDAAAAVEGFPEQPVDPVAEAAPLVDINGDLMDDLDGNVDDDMEGALEAIGMRGPVYGVIQNAALMIFVLDTAIGVLVWVPFTLGKSTALLSLNPPRLFKILHLPIRAIRLITDPIVDTIMYIIASLLLPFITRTLCRLASIVLVTFLFIARLFIGQSGVDSLVESANNASEGVKQLWDRPFQGWTAPAAAPEPSPIPTPPTSISKYQDAVINATEPYFAALGRGVRVNAVHVGESYTKLALGDGAKEKIFAISLGYLVVIFLVAIYLNLLTVGNMKTAGRAVRSAVREQLLVVKVAAFIFIELVTFPLGCGIVLDLCTIGLFPEASLTSRIEFFKSAPLTAMFYHWIAGTMFMYAFAVLLSGCRSLLRKGAMWFIKDPQDQNSHPIRDILDRPTLTQLRKILISGLMYSVVVALVVGSVAGLLHLGQRSILPFRWRNREPLSDVPIDLIFLHLALPYTMHYLRPRTAVKRVSKAIWTFLASRLRLSSYFFGGRYPSEERTPKSWTAWLFQRGDDLKDDAVVRDGTFRRVPATDNIALPREMRATAGVTENGEPIDEDTRELMLQQNEEAIKAKRNPLEDYVIVYLPPYFRYRVFAFINILWVLGAIFLGIAFALPIQLGRGFFALFMSKQVHDGYSFIVGAYLLWACYLIGRAVDRLDKRRQRRGGDEPRADLRLLVIKRGLLWIAKISYMALFLGIVVPTLISIVIDLYIVLPIRFAIDPALVPRVRIVDSWAMGLLYTKIILHVMLAQPHNHITRGVQHIANNGWTHPEPITATKEVIGPLIFGLLGMIVFPAGIFVVAQRFLPFVASNSRLLFMEVYPSIFVAAAGARFGTVVVEMLGTWSQSIRDKEFLVEMRLRNLEPERKPEEVASSNAAAIEPAVI